MSSSLSILTSHLDLNNHDDLDRIFSLVHDKPDSAINLFEKFPFHQLAELSPLNIQVTSSVLKIFDIFINHCNVNNELSEMLRFCSKSITFQGDIEECDFILLEKLLNIFTIILQRELELHAAFVYESLLTTLHSIAHHPEVPDNVLEMTVEVFTIYLQRSFKKDSNFGKVCSGMWKAAEDLTVIQRLALLRALIRPSNIEDNPDIDTSCMYLIEVVRILYQFQEKGDILSEILKCILEMYENYKNKETIMALSVQLATANFPKCVADYFLLDIKYLPQMHEILFYEITTIFQKTPWNSTDRNLREIITDLGESFLVKPDPTIEERPELFFVIFYFELLYKKITHRHIPVIKDMVQLFYNKVPTNPALLKSLFLLFAAYGGTELDSFSRSLQCDLLLAMQHCDNLQNYLSFHVAEVIWVMRYGSRVLKKKVVATWLRQHNCELLGCLSRCLKECEQQKCLLEVVCGDDTGDVRMTAMDMFLFCAPNPRTQLIPLLMRADLTVDSLECVMYGNPIQITLGDPDDFSYKESLNTLRALILRLIEIMTEESIILPGKTKSKLLAYLFSCCKEIRKTAYASCFLLKKFAIMLSKCTKSTNQTIASTAYQFLMLIVTVQGELKITFPEPTIIESRQLMNDCPRLVCSAVKFYQHVFENPNDDRQQIVVITGHLQLYHHLLEVLTGVAGAAVYQLVVILLERYEACVSSFMNIAAIRAYCREMASTYKYIKIPSRSIVPLIKYLDTIQFKDADYAVLKTIKIN